MKWFDIEAPADIWSVNNRGSFLNPELNNGLGIYIYGAGSAGRRTYCILKEYSCNIKGFIDADSARWGEDYCEICIKNPNILLEEDCNLIISAKPFERIVSIVIDQYKFKGKVWVDYNNSLFYSEEPLGGDFWIKKDCISKRFLAYKDLPNIVTMASDYAEQNNSGAGAVFKLFSKLIINKGGYICGAVCESDGYVHHIVSNNLIDIEKMCGYKYVKSELGNCEEQVKELLDRNLDVLFCGAPCQVAKIRKDLIKTDKFITLDFKCNGLPKQVLWKSHIDKIRSNNDCTNIAFTRRELTGWNQTGDFFILCNDGWKAVKDDIYVYMANRGINHDPQCAICKYRGGWVM